MIFTPIPVKTLSNGCKFDMSAPTELQRELESATLAIKFILKGEAIYHFKGIDHTVKQQQFITLNDRRCIGTVDPKAPVNGFCISMPYSLLDEVLNRQENMSLTKQHFIDYLESDDFFDRVNNAANSRLGIYLQSLASILQSTAIEHSQLYIEEQFLRVAELAVGSQLRTYEEFSAITASRAAIQKDLYRKLLNARDYLDANLAYNVKMQEAAEAANLSEYYFYRLFRTTFRCSPYQYLLEKRLTTAKELLKKGMAVSYVAYETGFSDVHSFSKAFKKQEGVPPSQYVFVKGKK